MPILPIVTTPAIVFHHYTSLSANTNMIFFKNTLSTFYTLVTMMLVAGTCVMGQNGVRVADIVTDAFFNGIANQAAPGCPGRGFYTRSAFLQALNFYPGFGTTGSPDDSLREIAAFFAHVTHETGHMCSRVENGGASRSTYCYNSYTRYPCVPGVKYYGRGPLQLTGNFNYGPAGESIGFDGLNNPGIVATNDVISFRTALWFWMQSCHRSIVSGRGFGATTRVINSGECDGKRPAPVAARAGYYRDYCGQLGVDPGSNTSC